MNEQELRDFIRKKEIKNGEIPWLDISHFQILSEEFIEEFADKLFWSYISTYQILSEPFIENFSDKVDWYRISCDQLLSEEFIRIHKNDVNWCYISGRQLLSEPFIAEFSEKVDWFFICSRQTLSEPFIREHKDEVRWNIISKFQTLSNEFIDEFRDKLDLNLINLYQKLNNPPKDILESNQNWLYKDSSYKKQKVLETGLYEMEGDYILAYKTTRRDGYSCYKFSHHYAVDGICTSNADFNCDENNSFGLGSWTKERALEYSPYGRLFKVKIHLDDLAALAHDGGKLRAEKLTVLEEVN